MSVVFHQLDMRGTVAAHLEGCSDPFAIIHVVQTTPRRYHIDCGNADFHMKYADSMDEAKGALIAHVVANHLEQS